MSKFETLLFAGALVATGCTASQERTEQTLVPLPPPSAASAYPNRQCLREIQPADTLSGIGNEIGLSYTYLVVENHLQNSARIQAGALLDICFNQIDDETGQSRPDPYTGHLPAQP